MYEQEDINNPSQPRFGYVYERAREKPSTSKMLLNPIEEMNWTEHTQEDKDIGWKQDREIGMHWYL